MSKNTHTSSFDAFYPFDEAEEAYLRWLEAPGADLGIDIGDARPTRRPRRQRARLTKSTRRTRR